jgi:hypothetical protein|tara:strand:- start:9930 stop:10436 length:507 start_codon:yes stop_codon:yes gene_type:complete
MSNASIVDVLIENIKTDQELLKETEEAIEKSKEEKREILDRFKNYRKDLSVLLKYADEKHRKQIEELGFDLSESSNGLNPIAQVALSIVLKAKDNKLTNAALYMGYTKTCKNDSDAVNYTEFNIKCRSLFNTQRLLRTKGKDPKSSKDDVISLNGRSIKEVTKEPLKK